MFIDGLEFIEPYSFGVGYLFCMIADLVFCFTNFLLQKSFEIRNRHKSQH